MSDLIERSEVLKQLRLNHKDVVYIDKNECARRIEAIPSADVVSLEEFEQMRFFADKSMEMVGEPTWTDALAELHEQFSALEKELRRASAEMSAIIRANLDRTEGAENDVQRRYSESR